MSERPSLRERNRVRTRDEIEAAALRLFLERGYDAVTVEQIADEAGVSARTFFRYFPVKEDVVFGDHADAVARLREELARTEAGGSLLARIRRSVLKVQQHGSRPELQVARARLVGSTPALRARNYQLVEDFEDAVTDAIAAEIGSDEEARARAMIVAGGIFGALRGARRAAAALPHPDPLRLVEGAFDTIAQGAEALLERRGG